jgi:hypothetical protein
MMPPMRVKPSVVLNEVNDIETFDVIAMNNIALVVTKDGLYQFSYADLPGLQLLSKNNYWKISRNEKDNSNLNLIAAWHLRAGQENRREEISGSLRAAALQEDRPASPRFFDLSGGIAYSRYFTGIGNWLLTVNQFDAFPIFADWRMGFGRKQLLFAYVTPVM